MGAHPQLQKFLESFYFQYGHASIADLGHTVLCFEGISELAATEIEEEPLWDGQAKSSRYQDFSAPASSRRPSSTTPHAAAYQRRRRGAARRLRQGQRTAPSPASARAAAASRRHEAGRVPAQHRGARFRRGALSAVLGRPDQRRPGDQHPHAGKADPPAEGFRVRGTARTWATRSRRPAPPTRIASGTRSSRRAARAHAGAPRRCRRARGAQSRDGSASCGPQQNLPPRAGHRAAAAWI